MKIQILGTGCPKCEKLKDITERVAKELGITYDIEKISDINAIMEFGVLMTPALVVDGSVKVAGKLPSEEDIKTMLQ